MSPMEYRQTRASIRDACSLALDHLDQLHGSLSRGEATSAREAARSLAMTVDDLTALCERIARHAAIENKDTERYAQDVK